jgi:hypothetical protein
MGVDFIVDSLKRGLICTGAELNRISVKRVSGIELHEGSVKRVWLQGVHLKGSSVARRPQK